MVFVLIQENVFSQRFYFKANRKTLCYSEKWYQGFLKQHSPFQRSTCFYATITGDFERFQHLNFETSFLKKLKFFLKNWITVLQFRVLRITAQHFHTKLPCQKPMLKQVAWEVQNGPITKSELLPLTTLFFLKI